MTKKILLSMLFVGIVGVLAIGTAVYATEHEDMQEGGIQIVVEEISAEEQEQAVLEAIALQIKELESEVNRLSLVVSKYVLEQQALALQKQLSERMPVATEELEAIAVLPTNGKAKEDAMMPAGPGEEGLPGQGEGVMVEEEGAVAVVEEISAPISNPPSQQDVFESITIDSDTSEEGDLDELPISIVASNDEDGGQGFFAGIRNAVGNLGTPEFVTVFILAVLAIFVIARRVASRGKKEIVAAKPAAPNPQGAPTQSTQQQSEAQSLDKQREELQERVAWK